ncbi:acetyl/propionyl-CoA carboxylase, carboxyltransferase subunit [Planoprotostelium fungivorum]|uniref:methylcrotonoyl-CoA carboxylase n=1 Tax=Planoprotostelium fungivorum TaxID=1890364 RepID=A0A2P6NWX6_9EUKA|nr:acetyl/propionyl-CoA carboxylase, carboxyltransferase subunit [Planoprotostelium fungivorum]
MAENLSQPPEKLKRLHMMEPRDHFVSVERWRSKVNTKSEEYRKNLAEMTAITGFLHDRLRESLSQGSERAIQKHLKSGQLLARDRIELLLDEDSPFLELLPLAGWNQKDATLGGSVVAGIGLVCVPTIKGGSVNHVSVEKSRRIAEIALENNLPVIGMIQSGGADLTQQSRVFHAGGGSFRDMAIRSKRGIPTITVVFGSSTAGGAYTPGMSDYVIMVKNQAQVFLGGPPLVKMATGEVSDAETLGGAEMHSKVSGVSDFLARDELHALDLARGVMSSIHRKKRMSLPAAYWSIVEKPFYSAEELLGVVPSNVKIPFDIREVIARIVDGSRFSEFKPLYGHTMVTCFARIHGIPIGILGNNGVLFTESAQKATQFISLCNQSSIPLLYLQNITGFMVGKQYERSGIIKYGAQLINAISNCNVPSITVIVGASYGAGNYGMNGRSYRPRFLFSWPNSKCSVMGPDQLSGVMDIVLRQSTQGREIPKELEEMANQRKEKLRQKIEEESDAFYTSSRMIDDGVIDPRDTRDILGMCLSVIYNGDICGGDLRGISRL